MRTVKQRALEMVEALSSDATWEDLMAFGLVQQRIDKGTEQGREGRVVSQEAIEREFLAR